VLVPLLFLNLTPPVPVVLPGPATHRSGGIWRIYRTGHFFSMVSPYAAKPIVAINPTPLIEEAKRAGATKIDIIE
jgi:hypothetical protein